MKLGPGSDLNPVIRTKPIVCALDMLDSVPIPCDTGSRGGWHSAHISLAFIYFYLKSDLLEAIKTKSKSFHQYLRYKTLSSR